MTSSVLGRVVAVIVCSAAFSTALADGTFRCGSKLINVGMTQSEVLQYCGEPATKDVEDHDIRSGKQVVGRTAVWRWTYTIAGRTRVLVFDQDKLKAIE
jgi:hypothetical protein